MSDSIGTEDGNSGFHEAWSELREQEQGQSAEERPAGAADLRTHAPDALWPAGATYDAADAHRPAAYENSDDIWADADPRLKAAYEATTQRAAKAENLIRSNEGRWTASQREAHALRTRMAEIEASLPADEPGDPYAVELALAQLREDYPDVAEPILARMEAQERRLERLDQAHASQREQEEARHQQELGHYVDQQEQALEQVHPDWGQVILGQDFVNWFSEQPLAVHDAMRRNANAIVDAKEAIWMLDMFKATRGPDALQQRRERQLAGSLAVPARTDTFPAGRPADDYDSEWDRLAASERRKAHRR